MAYCSSCRKYFSEPEDEQGDHGCPRCGLSRDTDHRMGEARPMTPAEEGELDDSLPDAATGYIFPCGCYYYVLDGKFYAPLGGGEVEMDTADAICEAIRENYHRFECV